MDAVWKFSELMAEWFRQRHAERAEKTVQSPWDAAGIPSPRTELIPARLFRILGSVCRMHGLPFKSLLATRGLTYKETGLGLDDCHPRFVACLLRLGDLLDIDDNRFCPVMQRIAGPDRPQLSRAHEDKHGSIRHLRIDRDRIEITAECKGVDGYIATFDWFEWIQKEIQDQLSRWSDIVPSRDFGLLPTLGDIEVRIDGPEHVLSEGQRPQFEIDPSRTIEILQSYLYSSPFECVRELLQNAVDATLVRVGLENAAMLEHESMPYSQAVRDLINRRPIRVDLHPLQRDDNTPTGKTRWMFRIRDDGTGISKNDLRYMLRIGGSRNNVERKRIIESMPEWMKPAGIFGIGFQSIFLICDSVKLVTKSILTHETFDITLHNPTGPRRGSVLISPRSNSPAEECGTTLEITLEFDTRARGWSSSFDGRSRFVDTVLANFDPLLDDALPIEGAHIADRTAEFSQNSPVPIDCRLQLGRDGVDAERPIRTDGASWHYKEIDGEWIGLQYQPVRKGYVHRQDMYYRGQEFNWPGGPYLPLVLVAVNLLSGKADRWLNASRETVKAGVEGALRRLVLVGLEKVVSDDLTAAGDGPIGEHARDVFSLFLEGMALHYGGEWTKFAARLNRAWLDLPGRKGHPFREFFARSSWTIKYVQGLNDGNVEADIDVNDVVQLLVVLHAWMRQSDSNSVEEIMGDYDSQHHYQQMFRLSSSPALPYTADVFAVELYNATRRSHGSCARYTIETDDIRWTNLVLENGTGPAPPLFTAPSRLTKVILLPFLFSSNNRARDRWVSATDTELNRLSQWTAEHVANPTSVADIRRAYNELVTFIDDEIMGNSEYGEEWASLRQE
ncbi:MAG: ATP-binding protein [Vulcanimicrobiaceae bacterium]